MRDEEGEVLLAMHKNLKQGIVKKARELNLAYQMEVLAKTDAQEQAEVSLTEALARVEEEGARGCHQLPEGLCLCLCHGVY